MDTMIAYCGLACNSCPVHLATLETNINHQTKMRVEIAEQISKIYGTDFKPEAITDCDGCKINNGKLFSGCADC